MTAVILAIVLLIIGFGLQYLPGDAQIKGVVRGIVIFVAIIFFVLYFLDLFGVYHNPIHLK